ncbi:DUF2489 domain-containing protein [Pseudomonas sp. 5P_3.1_Bac2]|uniref:DUF2489 domain-containing protein n=1 Tax=Pseudomonas sp. 5P_3.1_Bac2 TaxID=2971617 RepID=UPI0021C9B058|nr:DUF2489 domain-containing protein [Pseudomonas sp. 5P_3.1_Bac2]MCU1716082.1 DUF2489 domain-containing protein [Pseudomonas sp. 5P_3.1_Bac2]
MSASLLLIAIVGGLLVAALAIYASYLWGQVWARQRTQRTAVKQQQERLSSDIRLLAGSLLDGQLDLLEGAIRIKVLLDNLDPNLSQNSHCQVFHQLHAASAEVPRHEHWRALKRAQRDTYLVLFEQLHSQYHQQALSAARWLLDSGLAATSTPSPAHRLSVN